VLVSRELVIPVAGVPPSRVADNFLAGRDGGERLHNALDIMAPRGTRVVAADGGTVWKVRSNDLGGQTVYVIDDEERFVYYYAHLDRYADGLKEGQRISRGGLLGYVGTTGNAPKNAPHLHFQVLRYRGNGRWWDGEPVNPFAALRRAAGATP
jgi:murein DD-endopeptidase MepM/ murein hydrolase activator NlpD